MSDSSLSLASFDYHLPEELIAQQPATTRTGSRLMHLDNQGHFHDRVFKELPLLLNAGDLLVFNNTQVIKARLLGQKESGGKVEVTERIAYFLDTGMNIKP